MEGVSVAANLIALIKVADDLVSICDDLRNQDCCPPDAFRVSVQVEGLRDVLERVLVPVQQHGLSAFQILSEPCDSLVEGALALQDLFEGFQSAQANVRHTRKQNAWPLPEADVSRKLQLLERLKATLTLALSTGQKSGVLRVTNNAMPIPARHASGELGSQLDWLCPTDYNQHQMHLIGQRLDGTGSWFFESSAFSKWLCSDADNTLFCPGDPGSGRTMLAATVAERLQLLQSPSVRVVQIYCNHKDKSQDTAAHFLGSLIRQLVQGLDLPEVVSSLSGKGHSPSVNDLQHAAYTVAKMFSRVYVVIDALDECDVRRSSNSLVTLISTVKQIQKLGHVKLMCTSSFDFQPHILDQDLCISIIPPKEDVEVYMEQRIPDLPKAMQDNRVLHAEVVQKVTEASDGSFLMARLAVNALRDGCMGTSVHEILDSLPRGDNAFTEAYADAVRRIQAQSDERSDMALRALAWVALAQRPLTCLELQHALCVRPGRTQIDKDNVPDIEDIFSACTGLLVQNGHDKTVQLVHYTLQQFLEENLPSLLPESDAFMAVVCLMRLTSLSTFVQSCDQKRGIRRSGSRQLILRNPLVDYAACHWAYHVRKAEEAGQSMYADLIHRLTLKFGQDESLVTLATRFIAFSPNLPGAPLTGSNPHAVHVAAYLGATQLLRVLLSDSDALDIDDDKCRTPLWYAAVGGHRDTVELLLDSGTEIGARNGKSGTALQAASEHGNERVVQLLLERMSQEETSHYCGNDTSLNSKERVELDPRSGTNTRDKDDALIAAACKGHAEVVRLLFQHGAQANVHGSDALAISAERGHRAVVDLLLTHHANPNAQGGYYGNPLQAACRSSQNEEVVKLLLAHGANVNAQGGHFHTALQAASFYGGKAIVRLLLAHGADVNRQGGECGTALLAALHTRHEDIARLLLDHGAAVDAQSSVCGDALSAACYDIDLLRTLLDRGALPRPIISGAPYGSALQAAVATGRADTVSLLLDAGADINTYDDKREAALVRAAGAGSETIVRLLLAHGADVDVHTTAHGSALEAAIQQSQPRIVQLLIDAGATLDTQFGSHGNALFLAASEGSAALVQQLLRGGADVNAPSGWLGSALAVAALKGHKDLVALLLDAGADIHALNRKGGNALTAASFLRHHDVIDLLLRRGAVYPANWRGDDASAAVLVPSEPAAVQLYGAAFDEKRDIVLSDVEVLETPGLALDRSVIEAQMDYVASKSALAQTSAAVVDGASIEEKVDIVVNDFEVVQTPDLVVDSSSIDQMMDIAVNNVRVI